jgi:hypothetical protein
MSEIIEVLEQAGIRRNPEITYAQMLKQLSPVMAFGFRWIHSHQR